MLDVMPTILCRLLDIIYYAHTHINNISYFTRKQLWTSKDISEY